MNTTKLISASGAIILTVGLFVGLAKPVSVSTASGTTTVAKATKSATPSATKPTAIKTAAKASPVAVHHSALDNATIAKWNR